MNDKTTAGQQAGDTAGDASEDNKYCLEKASWTEIAAREAAGDVKRWQSRIPMQSTNQECLDAANAEIADLRAQLASAQNAYSIVVEQCRETAYQLASARQDAESLEEALKDARFYLYGSGPGNPKIDAALAARALNNTTTGN